MQKTDQSIINGMAVQISGLRAHGTHRYSRTPTGATVHLYRENWKYFNFNIILYVILQYNLQSLFFYSKMLFFCK